MTTQVTAGSVVEEVYFAVPDHYTIGEVFTEHADACGYAVKQWASLRERVPDAGPPVIDERWKIRRPDGCVVDLIAQRTPLGEAALSRSVPVSEGV